MLLVCDLLSKCFFLVIIKRCFYCYFLFSLTLGIVASRLRLRLHLRQKRFPRQQRQEKLVREKAREQQTVEPLQQWVFLPVLCGCPWYAMRVSVHSRDASISHQGFPTLSTLSPSFTMNRCFSDETNAPRCLSAFFTNAQFPCLLWWLNGDSLRPQNSRFWLPHRWGNLRITHGGNLGLGLVTKNSVQGEGFFDRRVPAALNLRGGPAIKKWYVYFATGTIGEKRFLSVFLWTTVSEIWCTFIAFCFC